MAEWWKQYEDDYLGSDNEYRQFEDWIMSDSSDVSRRNSESETDLLNAFRDTSWWTDAFLDWASIKAKKEGVL